ncbi:hypothetical protein ACSQ67_026018 [Phaseolus vulgaris]
MILALRINSHGFGEFRSFVVDRDVVVLDLVVEARNHHLWGRDTSRLALRMWWRSRGLIPDELVEHYLAKNGFRCPDVRLWVPSLISIHYQFFFIFYPTK